MNAERVQSLAENGLSELPPQFIRPSHEQPENSKAMEGVSVPFISLSQPRDALVEEMSRASSEWGFFIVTDHGISPTLIRRLQEVGEEFFRLPPEEKELYANDPSNGKFEGYGTRMTKNHDEKLEWLDYYFHLVAPPSRVNYNIWTKNPSSYKEVTEEYIREIDRVAKKVLDLLSQGLDLEEKALRTCLGGDKLHLEMKINMYPPCPSPQLALGVERHTDMSALTLLLPNHVPGLQLWKNSHWVAVPHLEHALYLHIGDQIQVMSNGRYKSVLHRSLVSKDSTRMSWAVFCAPPNEAVIGPLPQLIDDQNPPKYSTKTYAQYRHCKFNKLPQ